MEPPIDADAPINCACQIGRFYIVLFFEGAVRLRRHGVCLDGNSALIATCRHRTKLLPWRRPRRISIEAGDGIFARSPDGELSADRLMMSGCWAIIERRGAIPKFFCGVLHPLQAISSIADRSSVLLSVR
jgi:hypothetical protein